MSLPKLPGLAPAPIVPGRETKSLNVGLGQVSSRNLVPEISLRLEPQLPDPARRKWRIVCYGAKGVGKSTFAAQVPNHFFIDCEDGLQEIIARKHRCAKWEDVLGVVNALTGPQGDKVEWVILDTILSAYKMAADYYCRLHNVQHQALIGSKGTGWSLVANEIERVILRLYNGGKGLIVNAHSEILELNFAGLEVRKTQAALGPGEVARAIRRHVDAILFFDRKRFGEERVEHIIYLKGTDDFEAMVRTSNPQALPSSIPFRGPEDNVWSLFESTVNPKSVNPQKEK